MAGELVRCGGCKRHVFAGEPACPFCHASLGKGGARPIVAAVVLSAGLSLAGCTPDAPPVPTPAYGGPPPPPPVSAAPVTPTTPTNVAVPAYGTAPPPVPLPVAPTTSASAKPPVAAPAYGAPPPRKP